MLRFNFAAAGAAACLIAFSAPTIHADEPPAPASNASEQTRAATEAVKRDAAVVGTAVKDGAQKVAGAAKEVAVEVVDAAQQGAHEVAAAAKSSAAKTKAAVTGEASAKADGEAKKAYSPPEP